MADIKEISGLIQTQFPSFYQEEGPMFIDFVAAYYEWMESKTAARNKIITPNRSTVAVVYGDANIVGTNTSFTNNFSNGGSIAISRNEYDYDIFTINVVSNNSLILLDPAKLPDFAHTNAQYGNVSLTANPGYYVRRTQDSLDIDTTTSEFVVWFKEQYLKNIQFDTITSTQTMIKNSLDLYRSKGTPRSVDLLFRAAFGKPATVYYPSVDLFRLSSGKWTKPKYLELTPKDINTQLVGKQLVGQSSGASGFCDELIRKQVQGKIVDVAYISAITGNFQTGEKINTLNNDMNIEQAPWIVGSLNSVIIVNGGADFTIGQSVSLLSNNGQQGVARVANTTNATGSVTVSLTDGGYAFSHQTNVIISEQILRIEGFQTNTTQTVFFPPMFEGVTQPSANIVYQAATATPASGDLIYTYHANNLQQGTGAVLAITAVNSTFGEMQVKVLTGNLNINTIYSDSNTYNVTVNTYTSTTTTANVVGTYGNATFQVSNIAGTFTNTEIVTAGFGGSGQFVLLSNTIGANGTIILNSITSAFFQSNTITGANSGATATIDRIDLEFGVYNVNGTFLTTSNNYLVSDTHAITGTITFKSAGSGFSFRVANNFLYPEYINYPTDYITTNTTHYLPIALNAATWGFPGDPTANISSNTIANILSYSNTLIGKIQTLSNQAPGIGYNRLPMARIIDFGTRSFKRHDTDVITISDLSTSFLTGELITQADTDYRSLVVSSNSTVVTAQRLRFLADNYIAPTTNATTQIVGTDSGATANIVSMYTDTTSLYHGHDAVLSLVASTSNGVATEMEIRDSGFGYLSGETLTFGNNGTAVAVLTTHGTGNGFYQSYDGFLSHNKKLQDGEYWQTHSYEVRSAVTIDKYRDMLKQVVHVAGTGMFGNLVHTSATTIITKPQASSANTVTSRLMTEMYWFLPIWRI